MGQNTQDTAVRITPLFKTDTGSAAMIGAA